MPTVTISTKLPQYPTGATRPQDTSSDSSTVWSCYVVTNDACLDKPIDWCLYWKKKKSCIPQKSVLWFHTDVCPYAFRFASCSGLFAPIHGSESHDSCVSLPDQHAIMIAGPEWEWILIQTIILARSCHCRCWVCFLGVWDGDREQERQTDAFGNSGSAEVFHFSPVYFFARRIHKSLLRNMFYW